MTKIIGNYLHANFTVNTSARTLNTNFTPDPGRPVLVIYSVRIDVGSTEAGRVELRSDAAVTPTTVRSTVRHSMTVNGLLSNGSGSTTHVLSYLVPAGHNVRLVTTNDTGTPVYSITSQTEIIL